MLWKGIAPGLFLLIGFQPSSSLYILISGGVTEKNKDRRFAVIQRDAYLYRNKATQSVDSRCLLNGYKRYFV